MAGRGQSKQALENLKLWAGMVGSSYSVPTHFGELAPLRKAGTFYIYTSWVRPPTEKGQFPPNHKTSSFQQHQHSFLGVRTFGRGGGIIKIHFFPEKSILLGFPQPVVLWHALNLSLYFCSSLFLLFQERKSFSFLFPGVC